MPEVSAPQRCRYFVIVKLGFFSARFTRNEANLACLFLSTAEADNVSLWYSFRCGLRGSCSLDNRSKHIPPALKHGAYSGTTLLPGEDPAAFKKLHDDLIAEFTPAGPLEVDVVVSLARLVWRKQNLSSYWSAKKAKKLVSDINAKLAPRDPMDLSDFYLSPDPAEVRAAQQAADEQARKELGPLWQLIELGDDVTIEHLLEECSVIDRLDGMIDRCIKRLLMVRGVKSMSPSVSEASSPRRKRLTAA